MVSRSDGEIIRVDRRSRLAIAILLVQHVEGRIDIALFKPRDGIFIVRLGPQQFALAPMPFAVTRFVGLIARRLQWQCQVRPFAFFKQMRREIRS